MSTVGQWIDAAVKRNVKVLDLMFSVDLMFGYEDDYEYIEPPYRLVSCGALEVLRVSLYAYFISLPKVTGFPALRVLELNNIQFFNDNSVKDFLKSCPLLEDLNVIDCFIDIIYVLCISCPKLKNLRIDNRKRQDNEVWKYGNETLCRCIQICCPNLVFLEFACHMAYEYIFETLDSLKKAVIHPQNTFKWGDKDICQLLAGISRVESLSLHICLIKKFINLEDFPESLPNLKTLEVTTKIDVNIMDVLIRILTCSPNLESLHVIFEEGTSNSSFTAEAPDFNFLEMECTFKELKIIKMMGISAVPHHMGFIEFLLESSPVLETMSITPNVNMSDGKSSFLTDVLMFQRASPEAEIIFVQDQL